MREIHLQAANLANTIKDGNTASQQDRAKAMIFLRHHIPEGLKDEYLMMSAVKVKNRMLESGLKLDEFTYKALIHGFCMVPKMDGAKDLLFNMLDAGFCPSYCTYTWIVDDYCKQGNGAAVIRLPDEFARKGFIVDVSLYRALIRRLCKRARLDCAEKVYSLMQEKGILADSVVFTSLAYAYLKAGKSGVVSGMLDEMFNRRLILYSNTQDI